MKSKYLLSIILFFNFLIALPQDFSVGLYIDDTITVRLANNQVETVEINLSIVNNTDSCIILNKQKGIVDRGSLTGKYISDFCESMNYNGTYRIFMYKKNNEDIPDSPVLSVGDYVYFTKSGKLKYVLLEGVDNPNKIKRELKKEKRLRSRPVKVNLSPKESLTYKAKIYLGNFELAKNQQYYLILVYNNKSNSNLSNICLESNRLILITE